MGPVETRPEFDCRVKLGQLARVVDYQALLPSSLLSLHPHVYPLDAYCFTLCHALANVKRAINLSAPIYDDYRIFRGKKKSENARFEIRRDRNRAILKKIIRELLIEFEFNNTFTSREK